jgi:RNA polymerase sigma factor (sigma-70 family)
MNFTLATNNQLNIIIKHEYDCSPSLLRGAVVEMLNRGLFDKIIAKVMYSTLDTKQLDRVFSVGEEDLMQIGRWEVIKALDTFNQSKGKNFLSYVYQNIKCELMNEVTTLFAAKRDCSKTTSYNKEMTKGVTLEVFLPDKKQNVEKYVINKLTVEQLMEKLNDYQKKLIAKKLEGYTYQEMGEMFGKNYRTIHVNVKKALDEMRKGA